MTTFSHTKDLHVYMAKLFKDGISNNNLYVVLSKNTPWANDASPDVANTSISSINSMWKNMIGGYKILGSEVSHVVPRINWTQNTVYQKYSSDSSELYVQANSKFYVLTPEYNVYKCLDNGNNSNSTVKPISTNPSTIIQGLDGYVWKYMYTILPSDRQKFLTEDYMPVKNITLNDNSLQWKVKQAAVDGSINIITVTNSGSGYSNSSNIVISISGDGANAVANASINTATNTISSITLTSYGSGYSRADVGISGGGGSGATAKAEISPKYGHGYNPLNELGASSILISTKIKGSENGVLTTENDYRQVALLLNPMTKDTTNVFTSTIFSQTVDLTLSGSGDIFEADEIIYQGASLESATFSAKVVECNSITNIVKTTDVSGTPSAGVLIGQTSAANRYVTAVEYEDVEPYTGQVLYINNVTPVIRDDNQYENIRILLNFGA